MPNQDGTGPDARGPNTGRGLGPCENDNDYPVEGPQDEWDDGRYQD